MYTNKIRTEARERMDLKTKSESGPLAANVRLLFFYVSGLVKPGCTSFRDVIHLSRPINRHIVAPATAPAPPSSMACFVEVVELDPAHHQLSLKLIDK